MVTSLVEISKAYNAKVAAAKKAERLAFIASKRPAIKAALAKNVDIRSAKIAAIDSKTAAYANAFIASECKEEEYQRASEELQEMAATVASMRKRAINDLNVAVRLGENDDQQVEQYEAASALASRIAVLRVVAAANCASEDEEIVTLDENGVIVDETISENNPTEPAVETVETAADETVEELVTEPAPVQEPVPEANVPAEAVASDESEEETVTATQDFSGPVENVDPVDNGVPSGTPEEVLTAAEEETTEEIVSEDVVEEQPAVVEDVVEEQPAVAEEEQEVVEPAVAEEEQEFCSENDIDEIISEEILQDVVPAADETTEELVTNEPVVAKAALAEKLASKTAAAEVDVAELMIRQDIFGA